MNNQSYLDSLKPGDKICIQTPKGQVWETVKSITPYPRHKDTITIYTKEGGWYWAVDGKSRLVSAIENYIVCPVNKS